MKHMNIFAGRAVRMGLMTVIVAGLAACGGSGATSVTPASTPTPIPTPTPNPADPTPTPTTPTATPSPGPTTGQSGAQMRSGAVSLINSFAPTNPPLYTALTSIPTTGSATFNGYVYGDLSNTSDAVTDTLTGAVAMRVGFTATSVTVSGAVSDFVDSADRALTGTLALSDGALNRQGNTTDDATLTASANGTLTDSAGRALVIGVQLDGDFLGATYGAVGGEALGGVTVAGVDQDFDGGFIAAK